MGVTRTSQLLDLMKLSANGITLYHTVEEDGSWTYQPLDMASLEPWIQAPDRQEDREQLPLRIVASEVATQTKAVFPRDADLYYVRDWAAAAARFRFADKITMPFKFPTGTLSRLGIALNSYPLAGCMKYLPLAGCMKYLPLAT